MARILRRGVVALVALAVTLGSGIAWPQASVAAAEEPAGSRVLAWGSNGFGHAGDDPISNTPVEIPGMTEIVDVEAGADHSVALRSDGRVLTWGANANGQLGDGTTTRRRTPGLVPGLTHVVEIAAEGRFTMARRQDGSVWQWGIRRTNSLATSLPDLLVPTRVAGVTATSLGVGTGHHLAITSDGVLAWGYNGYGQLADGTTTDRWLPQRMNGLDGAVQVTGGLEHSIARRVDGTVWAVGRNDDGELGDGTRHSRLVGAAVPGLAGTTAVASGDHHALALLGDGSVLSWGEGSSGQNGNAMGLGYDADRLTPTPVAGIADVSRIEAGPYLSMALNAQGVWTWGWNTGVADKFIWSEPLLLEGTADATDMAAGGSQGLVLLDAVALEVEPVRSRVLGWGSNGHGSLGDGTDTFRYTPIEIPGLDRTVEVAAGMFHSLALRADGRVLAWGHNARGQVGDGTTEDRWTPILVPGLTHVIDIEAEGEMSLAIRSDGTVWQWGRVESPGVVMSGSPAPRLVPTLVPGITATKLGAGIAHALISANGTVWGWGHDIGRLGDTPGSYKSDPTVVPGFDGVGQVGGGLEHSVGLKADGTIRALGWNGDGQLGDGTTTARFAAITVPGVSDAIDIAVGYRHTMALRQDGTVLSWGHGALGQLGHDAESEEPANRLSPEPVPGLTGVTDIAAGNFNSLAINAQGVWAWGWSTGVADKYVWGVPVLVETTLHATGIAGGHDHGLALIDGVELDDPTPPAGTLVIDAGAASTRTPSVALTVSATDSAGVTHVALSNDGTTWTERPYAPEQAWSVPPTDGTRTVWAKWRDGSGNWSAPVTDTIVLDTAAPTLTPPVQVFSPGTALSGGKVPTRLIWSGADATSGVARYELRQRVDGGTWTTVNANLSRPSATLNLAPGHTYRYAVRAWDQAGNVSEYAYGTTFALTGVPETSSAIRYSGTWASASASGFWGGRLRYATSPTARATFTFSGRSVGLVTTMSPSRGRVAVYVNGAFVQTVDLQSPTWRNGVVAWSQTFPTAARRTVELRVQGTAGRPRVDLDGWVVGS